MRGQNNKATNVGKHMATRFSEAHAGLAGVAGDSVDAKAEEHKETKKSDQRSEDATHHLS